jgi:glycosyltransferase involved in cell wall biosynthesis
MSISVVIPAYRAERYLSQTLDSVLRQTHEDWEAIVVDDGSPDSTGLIAEAYAARDPRVRVIRQANAGVCVSRNAGLAASQAMRGLALFLDADDLLEPDALATLCDVLSASPEAPAAHGVAREIDADGQPLPAAVHETRRYVLASGGSRAVPVADDRPTTLEMLVVENCVRSTGAVLIRKQALARVGPWDQTVAGVADHDMWFRLARLRPLAYAPRVTFVYRVHAESMLHNRQNRRIMRAAGLRMRRGWLAAGDARTRSLVLRGYRAMTKLIVRRQVVALGRELRAGRLTLVARRVPLLVLCWAKTLPGAARFILRAPCPAGVAAAPRSLHA